MTCHILCSKEILDLHFILAFLSILTKYITLLLYFFVASSTLSAILTIFLCFCRKRLRQRCRALQVLLAETRERSLRAAGLAKMLRKDLEVAAEFSLCEGPEVVLARLQQTGHIRVVAPHSHNHFIFVPGVCTCVFY